MPYSIKNPIFYEKLVPKQGSFYYHSEGSLTMHDLLKNTKKTKISLPDYNFKEDIQNRLILRTLSKKSLEVLEEILFSSLQFSLESLAENLDLSIDELYPILESLAPLNLFNFDGRLITVDKDKRKYFETQITRFAEDFKPDLDFFQNLLKCLPIEVLPIWYLVPRSSNNIFQSLIDKHLLTPQIYQRYITELCSAPDLFSQIAKELFNHPDLKLNVESILKQYNLTREEFEETVLHLEFNILAFISFENGMEILTPFCQWQEYRVFLKETTPTSLDGEVNPFRKYEYGFIQDMATLISLLENSDLEVFFLREKDVWAPTTATAALIEAHIPVSKDYSTKLINKLLILGLGVIEESYLKPTRAANEWVQIPIVQRTHVTFKHPHNFLSTQKNSSLATQRVIIEIQKSLTQVSSLNWLYFDDFIKSAIIPLSEEKQVSLRKVGRSWSYALPQYTKEEKEFIQYIICDWLFESGVTQIGYASNKIAFRLTTLGKSILY